MTPEQALAESPAHLIRAEVEGGVVIIYYSGQASGPAPYHVRFVSRDTGSHELEMSGMEVLGNFASLEAAEDACARFGPRHDGWFPGHAPDLQESRRTGGLQVRDTDPLKKPS